MMVDNIASPAAKMTDDPEHNEGRLGPKVSDVGPASCNQTQDVKSNRTRWMELGVHSCLKVLIIAGLFCYFFHNEIYDIVRNWVADPNWSHGFLIPLFSLYFINQHKKDILNLQYADDPLLSLLQGRRPRRLLRDQTRPNYLGLVFLICGIVFYPLNIVHFQYGYLQPIGMIATLGAVVLFLGGWRLVKYTWLPIAFLVFAVPLPVRLYNKVTLPMQQWSAAAAAAFLNLVSGLEATVHGVVIDVIYNGQRLDPPLDVDKACSGMRLLMAFLALGVAMAYLHYRPIWQRIVLLATTIPIAIFCNFVRVTITGFIYIFGDPKYAKGVYHDALGLLMLPLAFGLYGFIAWFMSSLFIEESSSGMPAKDIVIRKSRA